MVRRDTSSHWRSETVHATGQQLHADYRVVGNLPTAEFSGVLDADHQTVQHPQQTCCKPSVIGICRRLAIACCRFKQQTGSVSVEMISRSKSYAPLAQIDLATRMLIAKCASEFRQRSAFTKVDRHVMFLRCESEKLAVAIVTRQRVLHVLDSAGRHIANQLAYTRQRQPAIVRKLSKIGVNRVGRGLHAALLGSPGAAGVLPDLVRYVRLCAPLAQATCCWRVDDTDRLGPHRRANVRQRQRSAQPQRPLHGCTHVRGRFGDFNASVLEGFDLAFRIAFAAGDNGACVAHALAGRRGATGDE